MRSILVATLLFGCGVEVDGDTPVDDTADEATTTCSTWCIEVAGSTSIAWYGSAAFSDAVYLVGDGGTIARRDALTGVWTLVASGTTQKLKSAWGTSSSNVWISGANGTVLHCNGLACAPVSTGTTTGLDAIWGSSATDIWAAGSSIVLRSTNGGSTWSTVGSFGGAMLSISGTGPNDVWVTGENTNVHHWDGKWTTIKPTTATTSYYGVLAFAANDVWVSTFYPGKETLHWNGSTWTAVKTNGAIFNGRMTASSPTDLWGVGGSKISHLVNGAWVAVTPPSSNSLWTVAVVGGNSYVAGNGAIIGHLNY